MTAPTVLASQSSGDTPTPFGLAPLQAFTPTADMTVTHLSVFNPLYPSQPDVLSDVLTLGLLAFADAYTPDPPYLDGGTAHATIPDAPRGQWNTVELPAPVHLSAGVLYALRQSSGSSGMIHVYPTIFGPITVDSPIRYWNGGTWSGTYDMWRLPFRLEHGAHVSPLGLDPAGGSSPPGLVAPSVTHSTPVGVWLHGPDPNAVWADAGPYAGPWPMRAPAGWPNPYPGILDVTYRVGLPNPDGVIFDTADGSYPTAFMILNRSSDDLHSGISIGGPWLLGGVSESPEYLPPGYRLQVLWNQVAGPAVPTLTPAELVPPEWLPGPRTLGLEPAAARADSVLDIPGPRTLGLDPAGGYTYGEAVDLQVHSPDLLHLVPAAGRASGELVGRSVLPTLSPRVLLYLDDAAGYCGGQLLTAADGTVSALFADAAGRAGGSWAPRDTALVLALTDAAGRADTGTIVLRGRLALALTAAAGTSRSAISFTPDLSDNEPIGLVLDLSGELVLYPPEPV